MKTIKKSIALLLALVMVLAIAPISAFAEDDALNYLEYRIENDEVKITGFKNDPVDLVIPAEIEGKPVTGLIWFSSCTSLQSITIPESITYIPEFTFSGFSNLSKVTIPSSVTYIYESAFGGCELLKEVHISSIEAWLNIGYFGSRANPLHNGAKLYLNNELVEELVIPNGITEIKDDAFCGCISLKSVTIPDSVTSIGNSAFSGCSSLESITIPDSVTSIGGAAFSYCSSLESITIGAGVKNIEDDAFNGCSSLSSITVAEGNPIYDSRDNCNAIIETAKDTLIDGCANTVIPNSVTGIYYAFNRLDSLENITIPSSVEFIYESFNECNNIKSVTIPGSVESVALSFRDCSKIESINIFYGTQYILESFDKCKELNEVTFPDSLKHVVIDFSDCTNLEKISLGDIAFENMIYLSENTKYYQNEANWENDILYIGNHVAAIRENATGEYIIREGTKTINQFGDYSKMKSVTIPDSVVAMPMLEGTPIYNNPENWENGELYIGNHLIAVDSSITGEYTIRENTKSMAAGSFWNTAIEKVVIPDSISFIPYACFMNCSSLKCVTIPNTVSHIGYGAFAEAKSLETIEIPESVEGVCTEAFYGCTSLTDAYVYNSDCSIIEFEFNHAFDKSTTIHSYAGGKVEEFANRYGYNFVALPPKPHTHTFGEWTVVTPATYTAAGEKTRVCTGCEETEIEVIPMLVAENVATNDNTGITVKYDDSVYGEDIQLDISEVTEGAAFELVNGDNGNGHHKSKLFDINTTVNGVKVQPNGKVLVGIPVPRGFNEKKVVIYYVTDDGSRLEKLDSYVENGIIWFETDHFSYYAVIDESEPVEEKSAWELFLDILRNLFRLILKLFSFSL